MKVSSIPGLHVVALLLGATACAAGPTASHHQVVMRGGEFVPGEITVAVGDTVTWRNADVVPHTVTGSGWTSGELLDGQAFTRVIAEGDPGRYVCDYHPAMTGTLRVGREDP